MSFYRRWCKSLKFWTWIGKHVSEPHDGFELLPGLWVS
jgi:hypothetical protein